MIRSISRDPNAMVLILAIAGVLGYNFLRSGGPDAAPGAAEVKAVVKQYGVAMMNGDGDTACAQLTREGKKELLAAAAKDGIASNCNAVAQEFSSSMNKLLSVAESADPDAADEARTLLNDPPLEVVSIDGCDATV